MKNSTPSNVVSPPDRAREKNRLSWKMLKSSGLYELSQRRSTSLILNEQQRTPTLAESTNWKPLSAIDSSVTSLDFLYEWGSNFTAVHDLKQNNYMSIFENIRLSLEIKSVSDDSKLNVIDPLFGKVVKSSSIRSQEIVASITNWQQSSNREILPQQRSQIKLDAVIENAKFLADEWSSVF